MQESLSIFEAPDFESSKALPPKLPVIGENGTVFVDLCFVMGSFIVINPGGKVQML